MINTENLPNIYQAIENEITRWNCKTCKRNENWICWVTEELIWSGGEYCETNF